MCAQSTGERQGGGLQEPAAREANVDVQTLTVTQERLRGALGGDAGAISAIRIMHLYLERLGVDFKVRGALSVTFLGASESRVGWSVHAEHFLCFLNDSDVGGWIAK